MKKFMKAIAFVTVMCMLLSTVAFANNVGTVEDKIFTVNVTEAGENEQVALMVVEQGKTDFSDPLYINQQAADASGATTFTAVLTNATVDAVDVYVGYANNASGKALYVGTAILKEAITEVTVTKVEGSDVILKNVGQTEAKDQYGAGVAATFKVSAPDGVTATHMIWAIRYINAKGEADIKYAPVIDITEYSLGGVIAHGTEVQLGLAFLNGSDLNGIVPLNITGVDAIFMFTDNYLDATEDDLMDDKIQNN